MKKLLSLIALRYWKRLIIYCVSFIGVFFIGIAIDVACGPEPDPYDYYISFFHNNVQKNDDYQSFYFNGYTFLNGNIYEAERDNKITEGDINVKEWMAYSGGKVTYKDISHVLYELDKTTDSLYFRSYQKGKTIMPDSLKNNSFIKCLLASPKKMSYLVLAKKSEPLVNPSGDDQWNAMRSDKNKKHEFALKYTQMGLGINDNFLKLRCFYQAQRLLHYGMYYKEASEVYDKYIKTTHSGSHVKGWALSLKAGEEEQFDHKAQAAYLYSKVFAGYPERRVRTYYDFLTAKVPIESVVTLAKNDNEKANIYAINGIHNPHIGLAALQQVYETYPKSEFVSLLLVREINKIEEGYLTPRINGSEYYGSIGYDDHAKYDSVKRSFIKYIPQLKAFCNRLATECKHPEPELFCLASAYLSWIQKDPNSGFIALDHINNKNLWTKLFDQKQLISLLLLSQSVKKMNKRAENKLLPSLNWLDKKVADERSIKVDDSKYNSEYDLKYYSASARDFYAKVLAPIYFKQKDTTMAALCILRSERTILTTTVWSREPEHVLGFEMPYFWQSSLRSCHLEKILNWERFGHKRPYLKFLMATFQQPRIKKIITWNDSGRTMLTVEKPDQETKAGTYDLLGTAYLREHKYAAAVKAFKRISITKLDHSTNDAYNDSLSRHYDLYNNPFIDNLHDYPRYYSRKKGPGCNKLVYAQTMAQLQFAIKSDPKNASLNYYKMATGMYNVSYYGNAWIYTAYAWASKDDTQKENLYYNNDYLRLNTAEIYFLKARQASNDPEFKARCTFMAARCRQKRLAYPEFPDWDANNKVFDLRSKKFDRLEKQFNQNIRKNIYFGDLKNNYSETKFYQLAINECSYFRDFLKPSARKNNKH